MLKALASVPVGFLLAPGGMPFKALFEFERRYNACSMESESDQRIENLRATIRKGRERLAQARKTLAQWKKEEAKTKARRSEGPESREE